MTNWRIKLLYDGDCPICGREVQWLKRRDRQGHVALEDIRAADFDPSNYGLTMQQVTGVLYGVLPDGRITSRMETFRRAYAAVGLGWLARPTGWPGLREICDVGYALFARNRVRLGRLFGGHRCANGSCTVPDRS